MTEERLEVPISGTAPRRRRWLLSAAVLGLVLAGVWLAWTFRPLTAAERHVLGTWKASVADKVPGFLFEELIFTADRRVLRRQHHQQGAILTDDGTWWAKGRKLVLTRPRTARQFLRDGYQQRGIPEAIESEFEILEEDPPQLIGQGHLWQRAAEEQ